MNGQLAEAAAAEELSRSQSWPEAAARWQAVVGCNPVNGAYWDRLAQARFALGDHAGALTAYQRAMALGVWPARGDEPVSLRSVFPGELEYRIACCHALLGDPEQALAALAQAARHNLRDLDRAASDEHLAALRDDARFRELVDPPDLTGLSRVDGWRADLRVLCQEIRRRIPLRHMVDADFEAAVADLDRAVAELPDVRIVIEMWRLLRRLGDGHAYLDTDEAYPQWRHCLPVWFFLFEEGLFIPDLDVIPDLDLTPDLDVAPDVGSRYRQLSGARVLAFDGRPVPDVMAALDPLLTRDNDYGPASSAPVWMRRPVFLHALGVADDPHKVTLTARLADGGTAEVTVAAEASQPPRPWPRRAPGSRPTGAPADRRPAYLRAVDTPYWFEYLPAQNLVYFQFNAIAERPPESLEAFYQRMFAVVDRHDARLAIDLRFNGGGNTFLVMPLLHHVIRRDRINRRGALFVVVGRGTYSAAQNLATLLDRHTHAVFVGEPTGSSPNFVGETAPFTLPYSRLRANVSDVYWQTSWPFDRRRAIAPDIYTPPTFAAYRAGRDVALEAILGHLDDGHR